MTVTLILTDDVAQALRAAAAIPIETAGVISVRIVHTPSNDVRILARRLDWVSDDAYLAREHDRLSIASTGYVHALGRAETEGDSCLWLHTHSGEGALPIPSEHDQVVDTHIADLFRLRTDSSYYGTLIVSPRGGDLAFTGYIEDQEGRRCSIDRMWEVGDRFRSTRAFDYAQDGSLPDELHRYDRHIRAFGSAIQQTLRDLRVGIVGCGGTGSIVAEQLVRLGVRQFVVIDPDILSASNVTRVYGSREADIGRSKAELMAGHLAGIAPSTRCEVVQSMLTLEATARRLVGCDLVFGCTDDNAGRLVLSRLATYMFVPIIDCGVLISSATDGTIDGVDGRITTLVPGDACLVCRGRIDLRRAAAELMSPAERRRREDEGYAPALGRVEPAVVAFTTMVGSMAVAELLERLVGYGPLDRPGEVLLRMHEREISTNRAVPRRGHYCDPKAGKLGLGITAPFLDQAWPE
jgi:molybdopterin/thiamine biosynthesis adenylyltransferase